MMRIGQGFDVHRFADDERPLVLAGVRFPGERGLLGHSDADAVAHAVSDALLGAAGLGDIGQHFPDTDPQWKGVASEGFVRHALRLLADRGYRVSNVDLTLCCEAPRLAPHRDAIRDTVAGLLQLPADAVNLKATTTEKLGFLGRAEGLAAFATVLIEQN